jgi:hypothetical protein
MTCDQKKMLAELRALLDGAEESGDDRLWAYIELAHAAANGEALLNQAALAAALSCSERHVRNLTLAGKLPVVMLGRSPRYDLAKVREALEKVPA